jgi:hypothetical protein
MFHRIVVLLVAMFTACPVSAEIRSFPELLDAMVEVQERGAEGVTDYAMDVEMLGHPSTTTPTRRPRICTRPPRRSGSRRTTSPRARTRSDQPVAPRSFSCRRARWLAGSTRRHTHGTEGTSARGNERTQCIRVHRERAYAFNARRRRRSSVNRGSLPPSILRSTLVSCFWCAAARPQIADTP